MVMSVNDEDHDAEIQFVYPHGPAKCFFGLLEKSCASYHTTYSAQHWHAFNFLADNNTKFQIKILK